MKYVSKTVDPRGEIINAFVACVAYGLVVNTLIDMFPDEAGAIGTLAGPVFLVLVFMYLRAKYRRFISALAVVKLQGEGGETPLEGDEAINYIVRKIEYLESLADAARGYARANRCAGFYDGYRNAYVRLTGKLSDPEDLADLVSEYADLVDNEIETPR
tara:strand:- start:206 stop:682 length:477 start_codon:yes stop_codon:yes gene_type:complete